jgi:hypothetical protein
VEPRAPLLYQPSGLARRARSWRIACALACGAVVLTGCGGSHGAGTQTTAQTGAAGPTAAPTVQTPSSTAPNVPATSTQGGSATTPFEQPATPLTASRRRFLFLANLTCHAARQGAPPPLASPLSRAQLRAYATQALAAAQRTLTSLGRLATRAKRRSLVQDLLAKYSILGGLYARAVSRHVTLNWKGLAGQISLNERVTALAANRIGLRFCSPGGVV